MSQLIIIQPWFTAPGHPAQSLINTAKTLGENEKISYLISSSNYKNNFLESVKFELKKIAVVREFKVKSNSLKEGTLKALIKLKFLLSTHKNIEKVLFFDADLLYLSIIWPLINHSKVKKLSVIVLNGPEYFSKKRLTKYLISKFLIRKEVVLFLRTNELVCDWIKEFPNANIRNLPSLEIPSNETVKIKRNTTKEHSCFGIFGQIRSGKSIDKLVPIFKSNENIGVLTIAGEFADDNQKRKLSFLFNFNGFKNKFFSEYEMLDLASQQDYIIMLYDNWDPRMESAMMFVAARVTKPVIAFDKGWTGRMIKTYGNGIAINPNETNFEQVFYNLPKIDSGEYQKLIYGVVKFKEDFSNERLKLNFINEILN